MPDRRSAWPSFRSTFLWRSRQRSRSRAEKRFDREGGMSGPSTRFALPRREFIRRLLASSGAAAAVSTLPGLAAVPESGKTLTVVIAGAGLAGLVAAYELEKRGHRIVLLEADARHTRGRVRTPRGARGG